MKLFQKIQLFSSLLFHISAIVVPFITFFYCCKFKKNYLRFTIVGILYVLLFGAIWRWTSSLENVIFSYLICVPIIAIFNYVFVKIQMNCMAQKKWKIAKFRIFFPGCFGSPFFFSLKSYIIFSKRTENVRFNFYNEVAAAKWKEKR